MADAKIATSHPTQIRLNGVSEGSEMATKTDQKPASADKKPKGWFSRRHETAEEHQEARWDYLCEHGPRARRERAEDRRLARASRSPQQQIALLDAKFGVGVGAKRERERLAQQIKRDGFTGEIWLVVDDLREVRGTETWENPPKIKHVRSVEKARRELETGDYDVLWLDHDLGAAGTIMPLVDWLCERAHNGRPIKVDRIVVHTANPVGAKKMMQTLSRYGYNVQRGTISSF